jgi:NitT/TauT family transport system substrate-binding protein
MLIVTLCAGLLAGCGGDEEKPVPGGGGPQEAPSFSLAWSEYPSWSVFGVASEKGIIDGKEGEMGPVETKWGVDIVLKEADYDTCLQLYGSSTVDAVCMTNMDSLAPCLGRDSVAVLPTSTSVGADACIVVGIDNVDALKGKPTHGLEKSVSQYAFERNLELQKKDPKEFPFKNMDPGAAAAAMQTGQAEIQSIMVWNPFVLQTLRTREGTKVLFDSATIPEEIIDMVVVGKDALEKPGGEDFVCAVIDAFYRLNELLADPDEGDETLVALGAKFSNLGLEDMKIVVQQTKFYKTPDEALGLYEGETFQKETTPRVVDFCVSHDIVEKKPTVGFGDAGAQLNFDADFIKRVKETE